MEPFHISATGHSLNYLPEYIAKRHGFFEEQGLEVVATVPKPWDLVLDNLADGTSDAALGGIWVPSMYRHRATNYKAFAQVANRSPLAIVQRSYSTNFDLSKVVGKTVLMKSGNGASVGLFFKMLLREHGIDPNAVHYVQDLDDAMLSKLFQGGMGDYFLVDNVSARIMAAHNSEVSVAMEMFKHGGEIPWSVYYQETARIDLRVLDAQKRFCVALNKAIQWVLAHDASTFQHELAEIFPAIPINVLVELTNEYRHHAMWTSATVSRVGYERWQLGISHGHLIEKPFAYDDLVDHRPTTASASEGIVIARGGDIRKQVGKCVGSNTNKIQLVAEA